MFKNFALTLIVCVVRDQAPGRCATVVGRRCFRQHHWYVWRSDGFGVLLILVMCSRLSFFSCSASSL